MDGLEIIKNNSIDILILDLGLPDINGLDLYKIIKKDNLLNDDCTVVIISAEARAKKINELYEEGIYEFIPKPVRIKKFYGIFDKIINIKRRKN